MAALKPTFADKQDFKISPLDEHFKGTADSWNQLKNAAIDHADLLDGLEDDVLILEQDIAINAQAIFDLGVEVDTKVQTVTGPTIDNSDPQNPFIPGGTTAGVVASLFLTGDETILPAGTFYNTNIEGKGTVATVQQVVVAPDDTREYFLQDLISIPATDDAGISPGSYGGWLSVLLDTNTSALQKFGIEVYRADADGVVFDSGVPGAPVGSYGFVTYGILDSGELALDQGQETQVNITAILNTLGPLLTGERVRYRVFAEKVGAAGGDVTMNVFYGINHNSYIEVPNPVTTDSVINTSDIEGESTTEALNRIALVKITENLISGYRLLASDPLNFGDIGLNAVDLSINAIPAGVGGAEGENSFTANQKTRASGVASHAIGIQTHAEGIASHAEGQNSHAEGMQGHAEGSSTLAKGAQSHAQGQGTLAQNQGSDAAGLWNEGISPDTIHETGIGNSDINRLNAFEIYKDGTLTTPESTPALIKSRGEKTLIDKQYLNRADQDPTVQAAISGAVSFDMSRSVQDGTLDGNATSIAFTNEPGVDDRVSALLNIWQDGTGGWTIDFAGSGIHVEDGKTAADFQPLATANALTQYWLNWVGTHWVMSLIKVSVAAL